MITPSIATYAALYKIDKNDQQLAPALALFNFLAGLKFDEPLMFDNSLTNREWAWCDALFMSPPAMAAVSAATGDRKYLDSANRLWWKTTNYLYDRDEHLFYRDSRYFETREKNGKKVFWSRGNGWVLAGLARMLQEMPEDYPDRARYVTLYRDMADRVVALQGADGYWRSSLLDPDSRPNPETERHRVFHVRARLGHQPRPAATRDLRAPRASWLGCDGQVRPRRRHARMGAANRRRTRRHDCRHH